MRGELDLDLIIVLVLYYELAIEERLCLVCKRERDRLLKMSLIFCVNVKPTVSFFFWSNGKPTMHYIKSLFKLIIA